MEEHTDKRKINFVYSIDNDLYWRDGLKAALELLESDYDIIYTNLEFSTPVDADLYIGWGGFGSPADQALSSCKKPKALCFAGGLVEHPSVNNYDVIFVEDDWITKHFHKLGVKPFFAFGTDTELFKPMQLDKRWDVIYPAAFATWKQHEKFIKYAKGKSALAVGYMQPHNIEKECYEMCISNRIDTLPRVTPDVLVYLYNMSREVVITANEFGGGHRTILEAMACHVPVNAKLLNDRLLTVYNRGLLTEYDYYNSLKKGVDEIWKKT